MSGPVIPDFARGSDCVRENRLFCADWVEENWRALLLPRLVEHVELTLVAVAIGAAIAFAAALAAHRLPRFETPFAVLAAFLYTIPSLALFQLLVPVTGLTVATVQVALVGYTLLILFRNTLTGLRSASPDALEAARGLGLTRRQTLWRVELPLALPAVLAGVRIAVVTTVSLATVAAFVLPLGLGQPIFDALRGARVFTTALIAAGGLAVLLAVAADVLLVLAGRALTPWTRARRAA